MVTSGAEDGFGVDRKGCDILGGRCLQHWEVWTVATPNLIPATHDGKPAANSFVRPLENYSTFLQPRRRAALSLDRGHGRDQGPGTSYPAAAGTDARELQIPACCYRHGAAQWRVLPAVHFCSPQHQDSPLFPVLGRTAPQGSWDRDLAEVARSGLSEQGQEHLVEAFASQLNRWQRNGRRLSLIMALW